ncbi:MAG: aminoacyl-tRNA hydrolase [Chlorobi bacterium]|nr:aminoacyl-tRNA hydrolase [Chlorobiota bacterium]
MKIVLGIGNPEKKYSHTRHNVGFMIVDKFALKHKLQFEPSKYDFFYSFYKLGSKEFMLVKPTTYVNLSGLAAKQIIENYDCAPEDLLIVCDDVNLDSGKIRIRKSGGDGGHNGLYSIIYQLETDNFPRLRFGIGQDFAKGEMKDYVLSKFSSEELESLENNFDFSVELIESFIDGGVNSMLDYYSKNVINNMTSQN